MLLSRKGNVNAKIACFAYGMYKFYKDKYDICNKLASVENERK